MASNKVQYVRIRDGRKIYGWVVDLDDPQKIKSVQIKSMEGGSIVVAADRPIPDWARSLMQSFGLGKQDVARLPDKHGFFEHLLNIRTVDGYVQVSVVDSADGSELIGSPLVAFAEQDLQVAVAPKSQFVGIEDEALQRLDFRQFMKRILQKQAAGAEVIVHPPFVSWNIPLFQRPQHMALAFGKAGAVSIYFTDNYLDSLSDIISDGGNLFIAPPEFFNEFLAAIRGAWVILYSTCPWKMMLKVSESGNRLIYEYVDHIDPKISAGWAKDCLENLELFSDSTVSCVVATAKILHDEMVERFGISRTALIPNGVTCSHFQKQRDLASIPFAYRQIVSRKRPIVGYYGAIAPWLDYELIAQLADLMPDHDFVFIGPLYLKEEAELPKRSNLFWYGKVDYTDLPHYAVWFDCCFIPFEDGQIAATTSPLKLFEYFSLGRPVVVTSPMKECVQFPIVRSGRTAAELAAEISGVLSTWGDADARDSRELAREHDWQRRAEAYIDFLRGVKAGALPSIGAEVDADAVFVATHMFNVQSGAVGIEVMGSDIALVLNSVNVRAGGVVGWRMKLQPDMAAREGAVISFDFRMSYLGAAEALECEIACGGERLLFAPYTSDIRKVFRIGRGSGGDDLEVRVKANWEMFLHSSNFLMRLSNFRILPNDSEIYCNHAPVTRLRAGEPAQVEAVDADAFSVLAGCDLLRYTGNALAGEAMPPAAIVGRARPAQIMLSEYPKVGDYCELVLDFAALRREGGSMRLNVCAPHFNEQAKGRLFYYVVVDDQVVYSEDVSAFSGLNSIDMPFPVDQVRIGVIAGRRVGEWKWGAASLIQLFDVEVRPERIDAACVASSPAGTVHRPPVARDEFLMQVAGSGVKKNP